MNINININIALNIVMHQSNFMPIFGHYPASALNH